MRGRKIHDDSDGGIKFMLFYLLVFAASSLLIFLSRKAKNAFVKNLFVAAALLIPILIAGLRSSAVGTDYQIYGIRYYRNASASADLINYFKLQKFMGDTDYGFDTLVYLCSLITDDYKFGMFVYQLVTLIFVYLAVCRCEKRYGTPAWLAMLLWYFIMYNASLNLLRQSVAVGISFYAFMLFVDRKYIRCIIFTALAFSMHSSAVIVILMMIMYFFLQRFGRKGKQAQIFKAVILVASICTLIFALEPIVGFFVDLGLLRDNFMLYINGVYSTRAATAAVSYPDLLVQIIIMAVFLIYYKLMGKRDMDPLFFTMNSFIVMIIWAFGPLYAQYIFRAAFYFMPLQMVGLANTTKLYRGLSRAIWSAFVIFLAFAVWYLFVVYAQSYETIPYKFFWQ